MGKSKSRYGELADADNTDSELGDIEESATELADGDDPLRNYRGLIGAKLERNMQKGKAHDIGLGLIFEAPSIPLFSGRIGSTAMRTGERLLRDFFTAFPAWFHDPLYDTSSCF